MSATVNPSNEAVESPPQQHPAVPGLQVSRVVVLRKKPKFRPKPKAEGKKHKKKKKKDESIDPAVELNDVKLNDVKLNDVKLNDGELSDGELNASASNTSDSTDSDSNTSNSNSATSNSAASFIEMPTLAMPPQSDDLLADPTETPEPEVGKKSKGKTKEKKQNEKTASDEAITDSVIDAANEEANVEEIAVEETAVEGTTDEAEPQASMFTDGRLPKQVRRAIEESGYTVPSDIQAAMFEPMMEGRDVIAQSQTGSGKTAAFALPILANLKPKAPHGPTVLVLAPTRELAMQVAASFERYAGSMKGVSIAAIYGGQDYERQNRALRRPATIVVGTPGRVIDHIKRGTLKLDGMRCLVLDEADEMLNMGFLEDVEYVLEQCPDERQIALFSATMPDPIRRIADQYLTEPHTVTIESKAMTADSIRQRAIFTSPREKVDLLKRVLEAEATDGVIVFTKTKESTTVVADKLQKAGHRVAALNGDMPQASRQKVIAALHSGKLNIVVATDVAARGLDVPRISHVINFDMPHDRESYVHRIGRTGRAGRSGEAILFLPPSARGRLKAIEKLTRQSIEIEPWPSVDQINQKRIEDFKKKITKTLADRDVSFFETLIATYMEETDKPIEKIAAALAQISCSDPNFMLKERVEQSRSQRKSRGDRDGGFGDSDRGPRQRRARGPADTGMKRYRVEVGRVDGVQPGNLVGAIANEGGLDSGQIGPIQISQYFTLVDLPADLSNDTFQTLQKTWVKGKQLKIRADRGPKRDGGDGDFKGKSSYDKKHKRSGGKGKKSFGKPFGKRSDGPKGKSKSKKRPKS